MGCTKTIKSLSLLLILTLTCAATAAEEKKTPENIQGEYQCVGTNATGSRYGGTVIIQKKNNAYEVTWKLKSTESYRGIGLRVKDTFAVSWLMPRTNLHGVVLYEIKPDGKLHGIWTDPSGNQVNQEVLTPSGRTEPI